jgi:hypothetical protein
MGRLLGTSSGTKVSRYENFRRHPSVVNVFAYEVIFNEPVRKIFAGTFHDVHCEVQARARRMAKTLAEELQTKRTARKLVHLRNIIESKP